MLKSEIKRRIANPCERAFYNHTYAICNEFGVIAFVNADHEQEALDIAADRDKLDCQLMSSVDYVEYRDNGWDDSYILAGNASEPFWSEYLSIKQIR